MILALMSCVLEKDNYFKWDMNLANFACKLRAEIEAFLISSRVSLEQEGSLEHSFIYSSALSKACFNVKISSKVKSRSGQMSEGAKSLEEVSES